MSGFKGGKELPWRLSAQSGEALFLYSPGWQEPWSLVWVWGGDSGTWGQRGSSEAGTRIANVQETSLKRELGQYWMAQPWGATTHFHGQAPRGSCSIEARGTSSASVPTSSLSQLLPRHKVHFNHH